MEISWGSRDPFLRGVFEQLEEAYKALPFDTAEELAAAKEWVTAMFEVEEMHSDITEYVERCCWLLKNET